MIEEESKKILAINLQYYMDKVGIDRNELCQSLGLKYSTVSEWLQANKYPRIDKIEKLANYFGIKKSDLIEDKSDNAHIESNIQSLDQSKVYNIPVFESVSAGFGAYASDYIVDYMPIYVNNPADAKDMLCIKVKGDSMYPKIEDGDTVVVRKQSSVDSGSIAVVLIDNEEGFVKKVVYSENLIELISINPEYAPKRFEGENVLRVSVVGVVKQIIKEV